MLELNLAPRDITSSYSCYMSEEANSFQDLTTTVPNPGCCVEGPGTFPTPLAWTELAEVFIESPKTSKVIPICTGAENRSPKPPGDKQTPILGVLGITRSAL